MGVKKPKRTPWFNTKVKPSRVGVYETRIGNRSTYTGCFSYWNGKRWTNERTNVRLAESAGYGGAIQDKQWRGLAEKPE